MDQLPYLHTTYWAETPTGAVAIRIGAITPELDAWLRTCRSDCWAYITACNPQSRLLTPDENAVRQAELESELQSRGLLFVRGRGVGDDGQWPPEESCCAIGLAEKNAIEIASLFDQAAIVVGRLDEAARLLSVSPNSG